MSPNPTSIRKNKHWNVLNVKYIYGLILLCVFHMSVQGQSFQILWDVCLFEASGCDAGESPQGEVNLPPPLADDHTIEIDPNATQSEIGQIFRNQFYEIMDGNTKCSNIKINRVEDPTNGVGAEIVSFNLSGESFLYNFGSNINPNTQNPGYVVLPQFCGGQATYDFEVSGQCNGITQVTSYGFTLKVRELIDPVHPAAVNIEPCDNIGSAVSDQFNSWISGFRYNALDQFFASVNFVKEYQGRQLSWYITVFDYATQMQHNINYSVNTTDGGEEAEDSLKNKLLELLTPDRISNGAYFQVELKNATPNGNCAVPLIGASHFDIFPPLRRCPETIIAHLPANASTVYVDWEIEDSCLTTFSSRQPGLYSAGSYTVDVNTLLAIPSGGWACSFVISVIDTFPPVVTCPPDIIVPCEVDIPFPDFMGGTMYDNSGTQYLFDHTDNRVVDTIFRTYDIRNTSAFPPYNKTICTQRIVIENPGECIIYVKQGGSGNGSSWASAFDNLQDALDKAINGDQIWMATGTYMPLAKHNGTADRHKTFYIDKDVEIYGGFAGNETVLGQRDWQANKTIISGDIGDQHVLTDNAFHVFFIAGVTDAMRLDGLIIEEGYGATDGGSVDGQGAGIYINNGAPTLVHCLLRNNTSANGGGIFATSSNFTIVNSALYDNYATLAANAKGGHIYPHSNSNAQILNCTFFYGVAEDKGQMIYCYNSIPTIYNCILWDGTNGNNNEIESDQGIPIQANNLIDNPKFYDESTFDFRIGWDSPARQAGDLSVVLNQFLSTDMSGGSRIINTNLDIGAYESRCYEGGLIFVDHTSPGENTGAGWTNAFNNLQDGLDHACDCNYDFIPSLWVADGTYKPSKEFDADGSGGSNPRESTFYIDKEIKIYGGFGGNKIGANGGAEYSLDQRDWQAHPTILSGELGSPGIADNAYHVVFIDGSQASNISSSCIIDGFQITEGNASGTMINGRGGGIYNHGEGTGNACNPSILNVAFFNNHAKNGGAIHNFGFNGNCSPIIQNALFYQNSASDRGGAIFNNGNNGNCEAKITSTTLTKNSAGFGGGAIYNFGSASGNCSAEISNTILWNNGDEIDNNNATSYLNYSIFDDGNPNHDFISPPFQGVFNFDQDPQFIDAANNDYQLQMGSPAINAGIIDTSGLMLPVYDLAHGTRIKSRLDVGAYEFQYENCPPALSLTSMDNPLYKTYKASGQIEVSQGNIPTWAHTIMDAPNVIVNANTEVAAGSIFEIRKVGCSN